jgi:hypothetical protein
MEHNVCKGTCGTVSDGEGTCSAEGCTNNGQPFEKCDCGDASSHASGSAPVETNTESTAGSEENNESI